MMTTLHNYRDGTEVMLNLDSAQYVTQTLYKDVDGNEARSIVTFSEETCFYVKETIDEIKRLMISSSKHAELIDTLTAEISYGNSLSLNQALEKAIEALRQ